MRIAIIGPAHPYKGGIAQHTTQLAHELTEKNHHVTLLSWRSQYPFFYPGEQFVPNGQAELSPFKATKRALSWKNPFTWLLWGWKLRKYDAVVFVWWVPTIQGPVYSTMLKLLGAHGPRTIALCHNVLPHEGKPGDRRVTSHVLRNVDVVLVHSDKQLKLAETLTTQPVTTTPLPYTFVARQKRSVHTLKITKKLLFFGFVRPYKGLDILLRAMHVVPDITLTVAGEIWGGREQYDVLIDELGLEDRVSFMAEYVTNEVLEGLLLSADAVVMPYKSGTATQNVAVAHAHGVPVIATTAGTLPDMVRDGTDGLLCRPDNVLSLTQAIQHLYEPGVLDHLRANVPKVDPKKEWSTYTTALLDAIDKKSTV